ncbi:MAG: hypothetical protein M3N13_08285, partial [Candidatus Eremiobacteraeota bacterium]|nr:hypothetical protein [Candidatus Eremiobacteraeota bacterium]
MIVLAAIMLALLQVDPPSIPSFPAPSPSTPPVSERSLLAERLDAIVERAKLKTGGTLGVVIDDLGTGVSV